ncbi:MAG: DUF4202 domain-containing protein [Limisphaerales bacterium]
MNAFTPSDPQRFAAALARFDAANAADPRRVVLDGVETPYELAYARWLTDWVLRLAPAASEPLRLAARCQHLRRWEIPRTDYPATRAGYLQWRQRLKEFHADQATTILREVGYDAATIERVRALNLKRQLATDPETQILEDALCLVFLEHQFAELTGKASREKMIGALQKCWGKMSAAGRAAALKLPLPTELAALLRDALASGAARTSSPEPI